MKPENLINWAELSRLLAGSRMTIRRNAIPKKHQPVINRLLAAIEEVLTNRESKTNN
jgi:hypothetical protein